MFLEEGFNVKVVLLPDGEDPDSYAQNHDSTEFIQYIKDNQTDFIRFKSALLSKEAGEDPFKRATLIKDITSSIAVIPDMITRQVYIKDCAERLHMSEKVLTNEVIAIRKKRAEERAKAKEKEQEQETAAEPKQAEQNNTANPVTTPVKPATPIDQNYYNLMQLVVKYGEQPIIVDDDPYTIGEIIIYTLEGDHIQPPQPIYQTIIDEFKAHYKEPDFKAESFFKFHPNQAVSELAIDMIAAKYRYEETDEQMQIGELVTRLLYEIKLTVINNQIDDLERKLKDAQAIGDTNVQLQLLSYQPALIKQRNEICKILGNRVINL